MATYWYILCRSLGAPWCSCDRSTVSLHQGLACRRSRLAKRQTTPFRRWQSRGTVRFLKCSLNWNCLCCILMQSSWYLNQYIEGPVNCIETGQNVVHNVQTENKTFTLNSQNWCHNVPTIWSEMIPASLTNLHILQTNVIKQISYRNVGENVNIPLLTTLGHTSRADPWISCTIFPTIDVKSE